MLTIKDENIIYDTIIEKEIAKIYYFQKKIVLNYMNENDLIKNTGYDLDELKENINYWLKLNLEIYYY